MPDFWDSVWSVLLRVHTYLDMSGFRTLDMFGKIEEQASSFPSVGVGHVFDCSQVLLIISSHTQTLIISIIS